MKNLIPALLLALALAAGVATAAEPPADPQLELKRVNLVVADLDRALTIYRDVLGFRVFDISESPPTSYSYPVFKFPRQARLRFATLDSAAQQRALALTEVTGVSLPRRPRMHVSAPVMRVGRLETILSQLRGMRLEVIAPQTSRTPEGAAFTEAAFVDFDGNLVVLYQLDAAPAKS